MNRSRSVRRPAAVLLALALLATGCGLLPGNGSYEVAAELTRSYNLFPGSPVRVLGVDVGRIVDLEVEPGRDTVRVVMRIDGDVTVPADASAIVIPESLLGERYVQLPAHTGGPALEAGSVIPVDRTTIPYEFDEVLEGLNEFVGGLDGPEVGRFVDNLAEVLDGQGAQLGQTIDRAHEAIGVLKNNDDELVALASRLADLNTALGTRDQEIARIIQDFDTLARSLVDDAGDLDEALRGVVRLTSELDGLLAENADRLGADIEVLTRVGRTAQRNLDNLSQAVLGSAELFRHAERVVDRDRNMLPLQNQTEELVPALTESIVFRLQGLCLAAGLDEEVCGSELLLGLLDGEICAPPLVACPEGATPIEQALVDLLENAPEELRDALLEGLIRNAEAAAEDERAEEADEADDHPAQPEPEPEPDRDGAGEPDPGGADEDEGGLLDGAGGLLGSQHGGGR
jgi:phospholipid/cholesterol/gamma-HCH transport system substrate-binding protein